MFICSFNYCLLKLFVLRHSGNVCTLKYLWGVHKVKEIRWASLWQAYQLLNYPLNKMCTVWMLESISHCSVAALAVTGLIHMTAIFNLVLTKGCEIWWYCKRYKPQINLSNFLLWLVSDYLSFFCDVLELF